MNCLPNLKHEKSLWKKGFLVIGVDEVGRGCLAGPLTVGAVCFPILCNKDQIQELEFIGINDSKKLTKLKREELSKIIKKTSILHATATVGVNIINKKGVVKAIQMAARKAIKNIRSKTKNKKLNYNFYILADAFYIKYVKGIGLKNQKAIIHGDEISISIAAASIIAKVERDKLMDTLSKKHPKYKWSKNKGYGTREHINAIKRHGTTNLHRDLFVRNILNLS